MVFRRALSITVFTTGLLLGSTPSVLPAGQTEGYPADEWMIETAVDGWNVGPHMSVASDPFSGETFMSFYDEVDRDLYIAWTGGPGPGNCGPSNTWTCQLLDSAGDVGQYNSIAVGADGPWGWVWISYFDATNAALKAAHVFYYRPTGEIDHFNVYTIDSGNPATNLYKGKHTSIALNPTGFPQIAYQYSNEFPNIAEAQLFARMAPVPGTGNCGEGAAAGDWQCDLIFNEEGIGEYADIEMVGWDTLVMAFYSRTRGYPFVATEVGSGGNCGPANSWFCRTVEHTTFDTGKYLSLAIEDTGVPHLAYYNDTDQSLEYATYVGTGGNCGFSSLTMHWEWQCDWIDDIGSSITQMGIDLALGDGGAPIIAYEDASSSVGPAALKIARPYWATDWNPVPNCGPIDLMYTWVCEMMDHGGATRDEADSVSMTVKPNGDALIAYREVDSYPYPSEGSIKVAYETADVFLDGFESGDTSAWSATVP